MGIKEDLHLVGDQYQWLGSLFYFGESASLCAKADRWSDADVGQAIWLGNTQRTACFSVFHSGNTPLHVL